MNREGYTGQWAVGDEFVWEVPEGHWMRNVIFADNVGVGTVTKVDNLVWVQFPELKEPWGF